MDKTKITGLLFYFQNVTNMDEGIREQVIDVLNDALTEIAEQEAIAAKKRKSPNKSGVLQLDPDTFKIVGEYKTQKEALETLDKVGKSGIGDALNGRTKTHKAYGFVWVFKDEYEDFLASQADAE